MRAIGEDNATIENNVQFLHLFAYFLHLGNRATPAFPQVMLLSRRSSLWVELMASDSPPPPPCGRENG